VIRSGAGCAVPRMPATDAATSRKRFLTFGAAGATGALLAACGRDSKKPAATAPAKRTMAAGDARARDIEIVNYALTLEHIEADFYDQVVRSGVVKDRTVLELAKRFGETERLHVGALSFAVSGLGGKPAAKPKTTFEDVLAGGPRKVLETAAMVENLGAAAYLGQAASISDKQILAEALSIHTVEARHAAALNSLAGKGFRGGGPLVGSLPDGAFARPMGMGDVLRAVKPFIVKD
jgi:rubrerythrin